MKTQVNTIQEALQQFYGTTQFFKLPLIKTKFTEGVKYLADKAGCFWLVTDASVIAKSLMNKSYFITIDFKRLSKEEQEQQGCEAIITYGNGNDVILETHRYNVTDFPMDALRLFFVNDTLMLPSEY